MDSYILTYDRGNTASKIALWRCGRTPAEDELFDTLLMPDSRSPESCCALVGRACRRVAEAGGVLRAAALSSVIRACTPEEPDPNAPLMECLAHACELPPILLGPDTPLPLLKGILYRTPSTLGPDRLAAAVGALAVVGTGKPILVVDLGTAVTYDYVDAESRYVGGSIAPGLRTRLHALHAAAPALPEVSMRNTEPVELWGGSTADAIRAGVFRGAAAELAYYAHRAGKDARTVLSGGDARFLAVARDCQGRPILDFPYTLTPHLIHIGLKSIIHHTL